MKYLSLFSGLGAMDLALERAGMTCDAQVEIDKTCRRVLKHHWPDVRRKRDVQKTQGEEGRWDLIVGGFPCQDVSVAGRRAGLAGERSGLFFEFTRILAEARPRWCLVENVLGLLSSNEGRDMGVVLGTLGQLGYGWAYRVLDAQFFGVAQRRRRVFIVGCFADAGRACQVLFEPESVSGDSEPRRAEGTEIAGTLGGGSTERGWNDDFDRCGAFIPEIKNERVVAAQRSNYQSDHAGDESKLVLMSTVGNGQWRPDSPTLAASDDNSSNHVVFGFNYTRGHSYDLAMVENGTPPITTNGSQGLVAPNLVRRLMPVECLRLMGLPDNYLDLNPELSDSAKYRMIGNAVAVPVVNWIGNRMIIVHNGGRT